MTSIAAQAAERAEDLGLFPGSPGVVGIVALCVGIAWLVTLAVYVFGTYMSNHHMRKLMREFAQRFPRRCFLCSYYFNVMHARPPEHDCSEWTAERPGEERP